MPYTTLNVGNQFPASLFNSNVRDQVVSQFSSTGARDAAIASPVAGMVCVTTDTGTIWQYTGSVWTMISGPYTVLSWPAICGQPYAAGLWSGIMTNVIARVTRRNRQVHCMYRGVGASTGTAAVAVSVSTPILPAVFGSNLSLACGSFSYLTAGGTFYNGTTQVDASGVNGFFTFNTGTGNGALGVNPSFAMATNDIFQFCATYEAASD